MQTTRSTGGSGNPARKLRSVIGVRFSHNEERRLQTALKILGALTALLGIVSLAVLVILPSAWLENKVRQRLVGEVERASGGRAEIGTFHFDWKTLTAEVRQFVLHGTEPA